MKEAASSKDDIVFRTPQPRRRRADIPTKEIISRIASLVFLGSSPGPQKNLLAKEHCANNMYYAKSAVTFSETKH